jgi:hypothetical protein
MSDSSRLNSALRAALVAFLLFAAAGGAHSQDTTQARPTGLPKKVEWKFDLGAGLGWFGFDNSLYANVRPDPSGDLSENWVEAYFKAGLGGIYHLKTSEFVGKLSVVGEGTYSAPPPIVGGEATSFGLEDAYLGWNSGTSIGKTENLLQLSAGRKPYTIGHGMLIWDGAAEGGSYGGFWSNARKAWEFQGLARVAPKNNTIDFFYLKRAEVPENKTDTKLWGVNYEFTPSDVIVLGATYAKISADPSIKPLRDGENLYNARVFGAPLKSMPQLGIELEYAYEDNGSLVKSNAWNAQVSYELSKVKWKPTISYRYAYFQGDNPNTPQSEAFDPLLPGFYDWGTWWQGEIAGEYFLANSNLISSRLRVAVKPSESVTGSLIGYTFKLDNRESFDPLVTSSDLANELDAVVDWSLDKNWIFSFVLSVAHPEAAVQQKYDRTQNFTYGMIYVVYNY